MEFSSEIIDEIVNCVMRELESGTTTVPLSVSPGESVVPSQIEISSSVITEEILAASPASGCVVVIPAGAVITPSGRDYIRKHGITVTDRSDGSSGVTTPGAGLIILAVQSTALTAAASAAGWDTAAAGCPTALVQQALNTVTSGRHALTCCHEPSLTACLVNRRVDRRAAVVTPHTQLDSLMQQMNPDVVCVSPEGWSFGGTLRLLKRLAAGSLAAPAHWQELST